MRPPSGGKRVKGDVTTAPKLMAVDDRSGTPDESLMEAYRDGDLPAFDVLVRRHRHRLLNFLVRMTRNVQMAEEVQADAWLKVHRAASRYEPRARFTTYLFTVAYRQCLTVLETKAHRVHAATVDIRVEEMADRDRAGYAPAGNLSPERQLIVDEQMRRLSREVADLPEAHRAAFLLYYVEGMSCEHVGEVLDLTAKEVKGRLAYARRLLRERVVG